MTNLPTLPQAQPLVDEQGRPTFQMQVFWDQFLQYLQKNIDDTVAAALSAAWSQITNDNGAKPQDYATLGADWTANLTGRPTELTDGRVSAGLTATGDLNRNITSTRANSSNILRRTSGGLYTGDLTATYGADLGSNVTNVIPTNLPPISAAGTRYKFTGAISYTSTATNATISVAAGSLKVGTTAVSYNAMSVGTTGSGGPITYYLYVSSNVFTAGAHTLLATTNADDLFDNDNKVWIGSVDVTYVAGGSGTGSGGSGTCPVDTTEILMSDGRYKMMRDCEVGEYVWTRHEDTGEYGRYRISHIEFVEAEVFYKEGYPKATPGHRYYADRRWQTLEELGGEPAGKARVCKMTVEDAHTYISEGVLSHNIKPV